MRRVTKMKWPRLRLKREVSSAAKPPWYMPKSDKSPEPNYDLMLGTNEE